MISGPNHPTHKLAVTISLFSMLALVWWGCSGQQSTPAIPSDTQLRSSTSAGLEAKEASMLTQKVADGELPPLEERLPENPLVAKNDYDGYEKPGSYGGQRHRFHDLPELGTWKLTAEKGFDGRMGIRLRLRPLPFITICAWMTGTATRLLSGAWWMVSR